MALVVTDDNLDEVLSNSNVLIDFWAEWCGPCKMIGPVIDQLAEENKDVVIGKLNVDTNPRAAMAFGITSIPTIIFFKNGEIFDRTRGVMPKSGIQKKLNQLIEE